MNVIWIVADTLRRDRLGCYGNKVVRTPVIDDLAKRSVRFGNHYACGFPTMPTRADHHTGRWTMSFMGWEPLPDDAVTLAQVLGEQGVHTAAVVDTPFYTRGGMNYDRGFQSYFNVLGQEGSVTRVASIGNHESRDVVADWKGEADRCVARTMTKAGQWLEKHYKEEFFLYIDTWDPHEPWDAPAYYTELYMPGYDGELVQPPYAHWYDTDNLTEADVKKAHACYMGEITMVDTWLGHLLRKVDNMGLRDKTAIIFTTDHGFYFGEHGGLFGKMHFAKKQDGTLYWHGDADSQWDHSPLYEELIHIPLLISVPGVLPRSFDGFTAAVDVMPTVLDIMQQPIPGWVEGVSLLNAARGEKKAEREFVISTIPFANPGDRVRSVDNVSRPMTAGLVTTITAGEWALLYSADPGMSELYHLSSDPSQQHNIISRNEDVAKRLHSFMIQFMRDTKVSEHFVKPRTVLRI